ncbi:hypothetical protein [Pseudotabrizicola algicola]|uniref:Uncharacterized protein n=1 Tax=Pseudotabrizicola algicola TaxID=2709381 RepID=A0A6B3RKK2_9RHOB|nr:hypothetical protein [Pseudotabrizicola algicola]NEX46597.1 hypothetical protein [Pseudotabrizicola algicola]
MHRRAFKARQGKVIVDVGLEFRLRGILQPALDPAGPDRLVSGDEPGAES